MPLRHAHVKYRGFKLLEERLGLGGLFAERRGDKRKSDNDETETPPILSGQLDYVPPGPSNKDPGFGDSGRVVSSEQRSPMYVHFSTSGEADSNAGIDGKGNDPMSRMTVMVALSALPLLWLSPLVSGLSLALAFTVAFFGLYWTVSRLAGLLESDSDDIDDDAVSSFHERVEAWSAPTKVTLFCLLASVISASLVATPAIGITANDASAERVALGVVSASVLALSFVDFPGQSPATKAKADKSRSRKDDSDDDAMSYIARQQLDRWDASLRARISNQESATGDGSADDTLH